MNRALHRLIVITCNTTTEELVDSTLCQLPGANYDNLTRGTYTPSVELPDGAPLFP